MTDDMLDKLERAYWEQAQKNTNVDGIATHRSSEAHRRCLAAVAEVVRSESGKESAADRLSQALLSAKDLQIECMRIVLSLVSAKAGIDSEQLVDMLREAEERLTHQGDRVQ